MRKNLLNADFEDFLKAFNACRVRYLLVGGYSVIIHGYLRSTMDMDVWVEKSERNYRQICRAFELFKMPVFDMTQDNFLKNDEMDVFRFGRAPVCIDLLNQLKGVTFSTAWENRKRIKLNRMYVNVLAKKHLIQAKKASGRHKDWDDIENLQNRD